MERTEPQETLAFKMNKPTKRLTFGTPLEIEHAKRMLGLTCLEVYSFVFHIIRKNKLER